jgi:hypothetical protein
VHSEEKVRGLSDFTFTCREGFVLYAELKWHMEAELQVITLCVGYWGDQNNRDGCCGKTQNAFHIISLKSGISI